MKIVDIDVKHILFIVSCVKYSMLWISDVIVVYPLFIFSIKITHEALTCT